MSHYRRASQAGGTFFFTLALANRNQDLLVRHIDLLKQAYQRVYQERPFKSVAICVLPDHLHAVWTLPLEDSDFSLRWQLIKRYFSVHFQADATRSASKIKRREKGLWQRRFWEHQIRDEDDLRRCIDYVHFNPVKHGYVKSCAQWQHSSFHRYVAQGLLPHDWGLSASAVQLDDSSNWGETI